MPLGKPITMSPAADHQAHGPAPRLTAVVPATDSPATLAECLSALRAAGAGADLIVVTEPAGEGPAAARNRGADGAAGDVIVFVDADVTVHADALERIRAAFASDPELGAVFGSYDDSPAAPQLVSRFRNLLHHHVHSSSPGPAETFWAGLGAVRREPFVAAGGFDADRFPAPAVEDIELGRRLRGRGERILLDPEIRGTHLKRWSLAEMVRTDLVARGVPWARMQLEERELSSALNLSPAHRLSALASLAALGAALTRRPRAALAALGAVVALNRSFYELLWRRGGLRLALVGLPLHVLHQLVGVASFLGAALAHAGSGFPHTDGRR